MTLSKNMYSRFNSETISIGLAMPAIEVKPSISEKNNVASLKISGFNCFPFLSCSNTDGGRSSQIKVSALVFSASSSKDLSRTISSKCFVCASRRCSILSTTLTASPPLSFTSRRWISPNVGRTLGCSCQQRLASSFQSSEISLISGRYNGPVWDRNFTISLALKGGSLTA